MAEVTLSFAEAVALFNEASGKENAKHALLQLEASVLARGVSNEEMAQVIELIDDEVKKGSKVTCYKLIHLLVPQEDVREEVLIAIMGTFPQLNQRCKVAVLKWIVLIKDMLTPGAHVALHSMYDIFFYYMDYGSLLPFVCRILHSVTKRGDVTRFRSSKIHRLFLSASESGVDVPDLLVLGDLYEQLCPGSVTVAAKKFRRNEQRFFSAPDAQWRQAILRVNSSTEMTTATASSVESLSANPFVTKRKAKNKLQLQRKKARNVVPMVSNKENVAGGNEVTLSEMRKVGDVAAALVEKELALPDRCSSVLNDTLFQHAFCLMPTQEITMRIKHNLSHMLEDEFFSSAHAPINSELNPELLGKKTTLAKRVSDYDTQGYLLSSLCRFAIFMRETPPEAELFLFKYLQTWNGVHHLESVTTLISLLAPQSFSSLHVNVLQPIFRIFAGSVPEKMARLAMCLCELLQNWTVVDWEAHYEGRGSVGVFRGVRGDVDYMHVVHELVSFIDNILLSALVQEDDHPMLLHAALFLYEDVVEFNTQRALPFLVPPSPAMAYRILLSSQAFAITAFCQILARYRSAYQTLQESMAALHESAGEAFQQSAVFHAGIEKVKDYNQIITDYCNALWLNRALPDSADAKLCDAETARLLRESKAAKELRPALGITHSAAFARIFLRFREGEGKAKEGGVWAQKSRYLSYLSEDLGDHGVKTFLNMFIPASVEE